MTVSTLITDAIYLLEPGWEVGGYLLMTILRLYCATISTARSRAFNIYQTLLKKEALS